MKIIANKEQLDSIGISYDISGLEGNIIKEYNDGWICLRIAHFINDEEFINDFDLPRYMCL